MLSTERRRTVRRESDRLLLQKMQQLEESGDHTASKERRHLLRRAIRHQCQVRIQLVLQFAAAGADTWDSSTVPVQGRLLDLSGSGCALFTKEQMELGQKLDLEIVHGRRSQFRAGGVIRWSKAVQERNGFASGVEFTVLDEKGRRQVHAILRELDATLGL